ncbi:unnamed protein product [Linum tenue]|uniref:Uncharacterized protein n=1 Tax=Linum tenue TaxID=586396 RepID=A0AAV0QD31_9ROSI|nr:unnamed protein product [Linum tenue]
MKDPSVKEEVSRVLQVLEALKQASHDLQSHPNPTSAAMNPLLQLETESDGILSDDPNLSALSHRLAELKSLVDDYNRRSPNRSSIRSFLARRVSTHSISKVAGSIESEIQAWIDRESVESLARSLKHEEQEEEELASLLGQFENRISQGFNRELQDLVLKARIFGSLGRILCDPGRSIRIRELCAYCITALIGFNKDVFAGFLTAPLIHALVSLGTWKSVRLLCSLIKLIRSSLVDEIEYSGEIPRIIRLLDCKDQETKVMAMDCVLEMGYFGRKEAIDAMLGEGLIEKLVELQRSELGGDLIGMERFDSESEFDSDSDGGGEGKKKKKKKRKEKGFLERHPFASCVARFAVQLEVGEGLRQREKRALKPEILRRVKEGCVSDAEAATIVAEVLWGSSP